MPPSNPPTIVLIGAGHAHLHVVRRANKLIKRGAKLILVNPGRFWYSGLATAVLAGLVPREADQVDPARLIERTGGQFIEARLTRVIPRQRQVELNNGQTLDYDWLSLNLGSEVPTHDLRGCEHTTTVKPIANLARLHDQLLDRFTAHAAAPHIAIVGGGATACEVAACIRALARRSNTPARITLLASSDHLLPNHPPGTGCHLHRLLKQRDITVHLAHRAVGFQTDRVLCENHPDLPADVIVLAPGLAPPSLLRSQPLSLDDRGILIRPTLQTVTDPRIFAVGDCASWSEHRLPKLGIVGVRQGPILLRNLLAAVTHRPLKPYRPQQRFLSILNLGDGSAFATWDRYHFAGRSMRYLKNALDTRFLDRYQR